MKKQTIAIIATTAFLLAVGIFIFLHFQKKRGQDTSGIYAFLNAFNEKLVKKNVDSAMTFFDAGLRKNGDYRDLVMKLMDFKGPDNESDINPSVSFALGSSEIKYLSATVAEVTIPATLTFEKLENRPTALILKIAKRGDSYSIIQVVPGRFLLDYVTYSNFIKDRTLRDEDRFSPETLAGFKAAQQLKTKYDSVIWFAHVNGQTFFYVVKGTWQQFSLRSDSANYKMGLVGPDMKEIIPVEYTLIHNINGTFDNLVEVEKGSKRGFFDLKGKNILPVVYDAIYPVNNPEYLAALKSGNDYYWLKNDYSVSDKVDLKLADILTSVKKMGPYNMTDSGLGDKNITEFNSRDNPGSIYIAPSYLVDLNLIEPIKMFKNPLRKRVDYYDVSKQYIVEAGRRAEDANNNWLQATFYKIRDYFLGGRAEFYEKKNLIVVDNKHNKVYTTNIELNHDKEEDGGDGLGDAAVCDVNMIRAINDSLYEIKSGGTFYTSLYDNAKTIQGGVYYSYLTVKNDKLIELPNKRIFGFTKYVKMTDAYLNGCYSIWEGTDYRNQKHRIVNNMTPEMLAFMKNEIYADYSYKFKDKHWADVFMAYYDTDDSSNPKANASVDDSLTVIDKYNINFITQKLNSLKPSDKTKVNLK